MLYQYRCKECGHEFEELHKVEDRNKPCKELCPECGNSGIEIVIGNVLSIWKTEKSTL